jgi:WD40 repeat protein
MIRNGRISPDGQHIVSESYDKLVKVWSVSARNEVASLAGHTDWVRSVAFSPDGQHIASWRRCGREWNFVVLNYISHHF